MQEEEQPDNSWKYSGNSPATPEPTGGQVDGPAVSWSASEFVAHEKGAGWFVGLGAVTAVLLLATYLLTKDFIAVGVIVLVAVVFGVYAVRQPRVIEYGVDEDGVHIGQRRFTYDLFKSFTVMQEDGLRSIELMPMKRFMSAITMYIDPDDEEAIGDALSEYLPFEHREQAFVDKLMRRLRF